jgi:hypothetical protein
LRNFFLFSLARGRTASSPATDRKAGWRMFAG